MRRPPRHHPLDCPRILLAGDVTAARPWDSRSRPYGPSSLGLGRRVARSRSGLPASLLGHSFRVRLWAVRRAFGMYTVGLLVTLLGVSATVISGWYAAAVVVLGIGIFAAGIVVEERNLAPDPEG